MTKWILAALVAGGVVLGVRAAAGTAQDPDEKLAGHFDDLCEIAGDNIDSPVRGVRRLGTYFAANTGNMYGAWGDTLMAIEQIPDDDAHDERAYLARERLGRPLLECIDTWGEFAEAVDRDREATELVQTAMERLSRTLEIILDGSGVTIEFRTLPQQLIERLAPT
jgi:hypothetical protein